MSAVAVDPGGVLYSDGPKGMMLADRCVMNPS
jgi:hypothetical protein